MGALSAGLIPHGSRRGARHDSRQTSTSRRRGHPPAQSFAYQLATNLVIIPQHRRPSDEKKDGGRNDASNGEK